MIDVKDVTKVVEEYLGQYEGYFLVDASVKGANNINVEIDHDHDPISFDFIVGLTRHIESCFDRDEEDYELNVSSAGLTTPLDSPRRYRKFVGEQLEVLLYKGVKERGTLLDADEEGFRLEVTRMERPEGERRKRPIAYTLDIKYDEVKRATYMLEV